MFKNISKLIMSHGIGQLFRVGEKTAAWKKVQELKSGMKIAVANLSGYSHEQPEGVEWDEIVSVKKLPAERVWDIEVEGTHNFVGNGIVAHNTSGILMRAGASSLQLSSSASSTTADIELAAADRIDLFAGSLSLQTSSTSAGDLKIISKGSLILDTSGGTGNLIMTKLNSLGYVCTTAAGVVTAGGATCDTSDLRLKQDIHDLSDDMNVLESLEKLRGVSFTWDETNPVNAGAPAGRQLGMIAQEVEQVLPSLVNIGADGYRRLDYAKMTGYLVEVAKALSSSASRQQQEIAQLSASNLDTNLDTQTASLDSPKPTGEGGSASAADLDLLKTRISSLEDLVDLIASASASPSSLSPLPSSLSLSTSSGATDLTMDTSNTSYPSYGSYLAAAADGLQILGSASIGGSLTVGLITIDDLNASINSMGETLKIQNQSLANVEFMDGKLLITRDGSLITQGEVVAAKVTAGSFSVLGAGKTIGSAVIPAGEGSVTVSAPSVTAESRIFTQLTLPVIPGSDQESIQIDSGSSAGMTLAVRKLPATGFEVFLPQPATTDITFDYWIVQEE